MRRILYVILLSILTINFSFAQTTTYLKMDEKAPFSGILMSKNRAEKALKAEKKIVVLEDLKLTQDSIIEYHKDDAKTQRRKLSQAKFKSNLYNIGYFFLGVILSSYAFRVSEDIRK